MKVKFSVDNEQSFLTLTFTPREREIIDARCLALGMTKGSFAAPCGLVAADGHRTEAWKSTSKSTFLNSIFERMRIAVPYQITDSLTAPLMTMTEVNIAPLRLRLTPNEPTVLLIAKGYLTPDQIDAYTVVLGEAVRSMFSMEYHTEVEIDFRVRGT